MKTFIIILAIIFFWFLFGYIAAGHLIGDVTYCYPSEYFGPFNANGDIKDSISAMKANYRRKFYLILGGALSFIFMFLYCCFDAIRQCVRTIIWMYKK